MLVKIVLIYNQRKTVQCENPQTNSQTYRAIATCTPHSAQHRASKPASTGHREIYNLYLMSPNNEIQFNFSATKRYLQSNTTLPTIYFANVFWPAFTNFCAAINSFFLLTTALLNNFIACSCSSCF